MILGLCGPFNHEDPQRRRIAERYVDDPSKVFSFSTLTEMIASKLSCYGFIHEEKDTLSTYEVHRKLEYALRAIPDLKDLYTGWMSNQLFTKALRVTSQCKTDKIEAVVTDINNAEWARWHKSFGFGNQREISKQNKLLLVPTDYDDPLNNPEFEVFDVFEPKEPKGDQIESECFFDEVRRIRKAMIRQ